jgi:hypothetical protein
MEYIYVRHGLCWEVGRVLKYAAAEVLENIVLKLKLHFPIQMKSFLYNTLVSQKLAGLTERKTLCSRDMTKLTIIALTTCCQMKHKKLESSC